LPWFSKFRFAKSRFWQFPFSPFRSSQFHASLMTLTILAATPALSRAVDAVARPAASAPSSIVIGFVGGFVGHDNLRHGPVQLAQRIRQSGPKDTYIHVFENRHRRLAYDAIMSLLDTDHDGELSATEKGHAHIILFGHSWGAAAAVLLARDLRRQGVPVLLTVQVDSIAKAWQSDGIIPDNVAEAINFYQPHGILRGRTTIAAANPVRTQVLGNYLEDYKKNPINCPDATWFARVFTPGHMQSECDPHVWSQIEGMVRQRLAGAAIAPNATGTVSSAVQPEQ
jgi:pimeloyl-ACP methyl ester carboxylesterase